MEEWGEKIPETLRDTARRIAIRAARIQCNYKGHQDKAAADTNGILIWSSMGSPQAWGHLSHGGERVPEPCIVYATLLKKTLFWADQI